MNKFILAENIKHILTEKYLLNERYILNEDIDPADEIIVKKITDFLTSIPTEDELKDSLEKFYSGDKFKTLFAIEKEVIDLSKRKAAYDDFSRAVVKYLDEFKNIFKGQALLQDSEIDGWLKEISDYTNTGTSTKYQKAKGAGAGADSASMINKIMRKFDPFVKKVNTAINNEAKGITLDNTVIDSIKQITEIKDELLPLLEQIISDTPEAYNNYYKKLVDDFAATKLTTLPTLTRKMLDGTDKIFTDILTKLIPVLKQFNNDIEAANKQENQDAANDATAKSNAEQAKKNAEQADKRATSQKKDWKTLYDQCNTASAFEYFWEDYYKTEWEDKAEAVKSFGKYFIQDLKEVGWDTITNPLLAFLKTDEIYKELGNKITKDVYVKLHNAIVNNLLTPKDLAATPSSTFGKWNIIFNLNLYNDLTTLDDYLKAQHKIALEADGLEDAKALELWKNGQKGRGIVLNNLMLLSGNIEDLTTDINPGSTFRPITTVRQLITQLFGSDDTEKTIATNDDVTKILEKQALANINLCKKVIVYLMLALNILGKQAAVDNADKKTNGALYKLRDSTPFPKSAEIDSYEDESGLGLKLKRKEYSKTQLETLLLGLAEKAKIYTPPKKNP